MQEEKVPKTLGFLWFQDIGTFVYQFIDLLILKEIFVMVIIDHNRPNS